MSDTAGGSFVLPPHFCCLELCWDWHIHAFVRFPAAFKASSWLEWVWASCFFVYLIIHIIIFVLWPAVLVARLGNVRKPRLSFWCTQLCGNSAYCFRLLLKQDERVWTLTAHPCPACPFLGPWTQSGVANMKDLWGTGRTFLNLHLFIILSLKNFFLSYTYIN